MNYSSEELKKIRDYAKGILKKYIEDPEKAAIPGIADKIAHILNVVGIVRREWPGDEARETAALLHDIGRFKQYETYGGFKDRERLHHLCGLETLDEAVKSGELAETPELDMVKEVIGKHGRFKFGEPREGVPEDILEIIDDISAVDDIENGCVGAIGYLVRESEVDEKDYKDEFIKKYVAEHGTEPTEAEINAAMKKVSPDVLQFFKEGKKFNKMEYCKTYADYTLFAAVLAIEQLKGENHDLAADVMQNFECSRLMIGPDGKPIKKKYKSALDGYDDIFGELLTPQDKELAMKVLDGFYNDKNYKYEEDIEGHGGH